VSDGAGTGRPIRVVIVDDQALLRTAFRIIFDRPTISMLSARPPTATAL
jgi:hypothetical protein